MYSGRNINFYVLGCKRKIVGIIIILKSKEMANFCVRFFKKFIVILLYLFISAIYSFRIKTIYFSEQSILRDIEK